MQGQDQPPIVDITANYRICNCHKALAALPFNQLYIANTATLKVHTKIDLNNHLEPEQLDETSPINPRDNVIKKQLN